MLEEIVEVRSRVRAREVIGKLLLEMMQTLFASVVAMLAIILLRETEPWLHDSDDAVAYSGFWLVLFWLFALLASSFERAILMDANVLFFASPVPAELFFQPCRRPLPLTLPVP